MMMWIDRHRNLLSVVALPLLLVAFACSSDSPSEPAADAPPTPGQPGAAQFNVEVSADPGVLTAGRSDESSTISIRVRRRDNGAAPPNGTTIVVTTSLGFFANQAQQIVAALTGGRAQLQLFPGDTGGTATVEARIESSLGRVRVRIAEPDEFFLSFVEPSQGDDAGGEEVVINGGGIVRPVRVMIAGSVAQVLSAGRSRIRVVTPPSPTPVGANQTLPVNVTVTIALNSTEQASDTLVNGFTYTPGGFDSEQPVILSVSPPSGPNEGGTRVTITGDGFEPPVQVLFGQGEVGAFRGVEAQIESASASRLAVIAPPATGLGQDNRNSEVSILVRNLDSGTATVGTNVYRYGEPIFISGISPLNGLAAGGDLVSIFGTGFEDPLQVTHAGIEQTVESIAPDEIVFRTSGVSVQSCPSDGVVVSAPVQVRLLDEGGAGTGVVVTSDQAFTYVVNIPQILGLSPTGGPQAGGTTVTIDGREFGDPVRVSFISPTGQAFSAEVVSISPTSITVRSPQVTAGALEQVDCDDNGDGQVGSKFLETAFDVEVRNLATGCSDIFPNSFVYTPSDTTCRGDQRPPQCSDGVDNDGDGDTDLADPECSGPNDDDEAT